MRFNDFSLKKNKVLRIAVIVCAVCIVELFLRQFGALKFVEHTFLDTQFQMRNRIQGADTNIVFIAIDQKSLDLFDKEGVGWPWPRSFYKKILQFAEEGKAKAVVFDIDFSNNLNNGEVESSDDLEFADELKKAPNPFLIMVAQMDTANNRIDYSQAKHLEGNEIIFPAPKKYTGVSLPQKTFLLENVNLGVANLFADKDGIIRNAYFSFKVGSKYYAYLPYALFLKLSNLKNIYFPKEKKFLINWYGGGGPDGTYKYYSFASVLLSQLKYEKNMPPIIPPSILRNKVIFVGGIAKGLLDIKNTPMSQLGLFPGMEVHAVVFNNLINADFLFPVQRWLEFTLSLLLALLTVYFVDSLKMYFSFPLVALLIIVLISVSLNLFESNYYLRIVYPVFSSLLAVFLTVVFNYLIVGREKKQLKMLFSKYVMPDVVEELIANPELVELKGKEIFATVFFSDVANFTSISEGLTPQKLVSHLNNYFEIVSNILLKNRAMIDKYMGDGIMAVFGAPVSIKEHAELACRSALKIQELLNHSVKDNGTPETPIFNTRIGLHSGEMIVGNVGTSLRMDYTAIGDTVNTASRLESANKIYGTRVLVSESTYRLVKDKFLFREIDLIAVKGKRIPIKIYELQNNENNNIERKKIIEVFETALSLYRSRKLEEAIEKFENFLKLWGDDDAAKLYINRCKMFLKNPPPENWDGVFYATTK